MAVRAPYLFSLPEYDRAFREFIGDAIHSLARAKDPILSQIRYEEQESIPTSQISGEMENVELPPFSASVELRVDHEDVIQGHIDSVVALVDDAADQHLRQVMPKLFEAISRITDATGNKVDAGGRPFSPELLLEVLEKMEWSFDEQGEPIMPTLVMSTEMADKVSRLPPLTPEQEEAFEGLKERKRAEYRDRRRHRKLS